MEKDADADEREATKARAATLAALKSSGETLGGFLAAKRAVAAKGRPPTERRRGVHAHRKSVEDEFNRLWAAQAQHHPKLLTDDLKEKVADAIFAQRPVFWRLNTLGTCPFVPSGDLCPKGAWLSQQKRMLEKLNNLGLAGGNARPLDGEERAAILAKLQTQATMSWSGVRSALAPLYKARGEKGLEKSLKFNLELGGDAKLIGNPLESKLSGIFGEGWNHHPHQQAIRDAVHSRLWAADYGRVSNQRVVIRPSSERAVARVAAAESFIRDFGVTVEEALALQALSFPTGWEPYSIEALKAFLPELARGVRFGDLLAKPEWEAWRAKNFPERAQPTGEVRDSLPSPSGRSQDGKQEQRRIASLRNPTVVRTQNEMRKVVNNLIRVYGKPDKIRVEVSRDVGRSKREREEIKSIIRRNERQRDAARKDLQSKGIAEPSPKDIEKWLLWKESQEKCPYTGDSISFDALFREGRYQVEHIWPRSLSFDDSFRNKTLCRTDVNIEKGNRTPFEAFGNDADRWSKIETLLNGMVVRKGATGGMPPGKIRRFLARSMPDDFASRQLNDTRYASKLILAQLKRLWPDLGQNAPVNVQAVTGGVTAQLRKLWGLNNILSDDGEKTRADHRHHAIDALVVACVDPGVTNRLSRYWQAKDDPRATAPRLDPPWPSIRSEAEKAVSEIVVSHRVRKKVSGPLHKETIYGDTGDNIKTKSGIYRQFVTRKKVESLSKGEIAEIRDAKVRDTIASWVESRGGDPKKAFPPYPRLAANGPEIRKVRLVSKQQLTLMAPVSTGFADLGNNHHIAIYRNAGGKVEFDVVSLFAATRHLSSKGGVIRRSTGDAQFLMSLAAGETIKVPTGVKAGLWIVSGVWANGQIVIEAANDADHKTTTRPAPSALIKDQAVKVSIDPIGRVRPARD